MSFLDPWLFLLLGLVPVLVVYHLRSRRPRSLRFSSTHAASALPKSLRSRLAEAPFALRMVAFCLLVVGLARPVVGLQASRNPTRGIAIEMAIDRSGSMQSPMRFGGRSETRLAVVKEVFRSFVTGRAIGLGGRPNDLIGLVTFARYADTICPLTLDHRALLSLLKKIHRPVDPALDGTAIGDGLALAAAHLEALGSEIKGIRGHRYHIKSKVIILLTDGQNNFGRTTPLEAARLARKWGIRIYTIGIGSGGGPVRVNTIFGPQTINGRTAVNVSMLKKIAGRTGGVFQLASSGSGLKKVYQTIDKLEKSALPTSGYADWRELYLPFVLAALAALLAGIALESTVLRRIP